MGNHKVYLLAVIVEVIGIAVVGTGIGLELAHGGEVFLMVITTGSCLTAGGGILFDKVLRGQKQ